RAMEQLYITYADVRRLYGEEKYTRPSRFIGEIPAEYIEEVRMRGSVSAPLFRRETRPQGGDEAAGLSVGQQVLHPKFGHGTVLSCEGSGAQTRVQVNFDEVRSKWLVLAYAKLEAV
ncbi:MAG TPA: DNA helicase II, partial [Gammaproteobacteria bacterium]